MATGRDATGRIAVIHVVLPAFNEEANIEATLEQLWRRLEPLALRCRVVLVDDGSSDGTASLARAGSSREHPVEVVSHESNRGPGAAFRTGFLHVLADAAASDVLVTLEADRTSDPRILMRLLHRIWEEGDDIALASCYLYGGGIVGTQMHRVLLSHLANGLMKKSLGLTGLQTLSSFYRAYSVAGLRRIHERFGDRFITSDGFECMVEILYRAAQLELRISEVPMRLDGGRRVGASSMRVTRTSIAYLRLAARALLGRL